MRKSRKPPGDLVDSLDRASAVGVTIYSWTPSFAVLVAVACFFFVSCTGTPGDEDGTQPTEESIPQGATPAGSDLVVDRGVDLESGVLRIAMVGSVPPGVLSAHIDYWDAVNSEFGGIGGRLRVEVVAVDSMRDALTAGGLAVSIDAGEESGIVSEMLVAVSSGGELPEGRLGGLIGSDIGIQAAAGLSALETNAASLDVGWSPGDDVILVKHPERDCDAATFDFGVGHMDSGSITVLDDPVLFVLCVPPEEVLAVAAEVLAASPGSALLIPGSSWRPELAQLLAGTDVVVAGYIPEPGTEGAPGADVMGIALDARQWSHGEVHGYLSALVMHAVLESAFLDGDLTRLAVRALGIDAGDFDLGFGRAMIHVGVADATSPTGVRFVIWIAP